MNDFVNLATGAGADSDVIATAMRLASSPSAIDTTTPGWLATMFGKNLVSVTNSLTRYAGIRASTASSMLMLWAVQKSERLVPVERVSIRRRAAGGSTASKSEGYMRLFLAAVTLVVWAIPASAQWLDRATPGIPRTPDGKPNLAAPAPRAPNGKIDFSGIWNGPVPDTDPDPTNAQPWINELVLQRQREYHRTRPSYQCLPSGPEADRFAGWKRIIQTPTAIAILNDDLTYRMIFMVGP